MIKMNRVLTTILAILLLISALVGCAVDYVEDKENGTDDVGVGNDSEIIRGEPISADQLAANIREGEHEGDYVFLAPIHGVAQTQSLEWEINFNPEDRDFEDLSQLLNVYTDSSFRISTNPRIEYDAEKGALIISPTTPVPTIWALGDHPTGSWGYYEQYFIVRYF